MPKAIVLYVRYVEALNYRVGRVAMYLIYAMMGILLYSSISKTFFTPALWTLETAQFVMVAYYILGGAYSLQMGSHVRMDLAYSHWSPRTRVVVDLFTVFFLLFYLGVLFYGGVSSTHYALEYGEQSYSAWAPPMAPIKLIMCFGILLMLLQTFALFFRDLSIVLGQPIQSRVVDEESGA